MRKIFLIYFKEIFINNYTLAPTSAIVAIFTHNYPNIDPNDPEINKNINTKYNELQKILNTDYIFALYDNDGINISKVINYDVKKRSNNIININKV